MEVYGGPLRLPRGLGYLPSHSENDGWYLVLVSWDYLGNPEKLPLELGPLPLYPARYGWYSVLGPWNHTTDNPKQANRVSEGSSENNLLIPVSTMNPPRNISDDHTKEPLAWRLDRKIGTGTLGTVFLEKVQTHEIKSPELWAVKRISKAVPNFPVRNYQAEVKNLRALLNVSFIQTHILS